MTPNEQYWEWLYLSLLNHFEDGVNSAVIPIRVIGTPPIQLEEFDDWYDFHTLDIVKQITRDNVYEAEFFFQITCFSKSAQLRADKKISAVYSMAGKVLNLFENKCVPIRAWTQEKEEPDLVGSMRIFEGTQKYIGQKSIGGIQDTGVSNPSINAISSIITFNAKSEVK